MKDINKRLAALENRIQILEDELAIRNMFVYYGMAADTGDAQRLASTFTEDGIYEVGSPEGPMSGRRDVYDMILGTDHQSRLPNLAHFVGPLAIKFNGDKAVAYGYSRTLIKKGDLMEIWRLAYNRIELERKDGRWQMILRTNLMVGTEGAQDIFKEGLASLDT